MTARGLRPLMESLAGRVRDRGGASASASPAEVAAAPRAAAEEARNLRRDRRSSRSSMGAPAEAAGGGRPPSGYHERAGVASISFIVVAARVRTGKAALAIRRGIDTAR